MKLSYPDKRFEIQVWDKKANLDFSFEPSLFNLPEFVCLNNAQGLISFFLIRKSTGKADALFHFLLSDTMAVSRHKSPFGSVECSKNLSLELIENFIKTVFKSLKNRQIQEVIIKHYPFIYADNQSSLVVNSFFNLNLTVALSQINHHLAVTENSFEKCLHKSALRRLNKCRKTGLCFNQENVGKLPEIYDLIKKCRIEKNKPLSLSEAELTQLFQYFPNRYLIFSVSSPDEILAVTVAVKVNADILLTVYPASPARFNDLSPTIFLNEGLYKYCQENGYKLLDLGISGTKEDPQYSLMKFKENLGGKASLKLTFTGKLPDLWN